MTALGKGLLARSIQHALLGASSSYRWMNCPGSVKLSMSVPSGSSSLYAAEGKAAHKLAETVLEDPVPIRSAHDFIGRAKIELDDEDASFEVTTDMADAVQVYVNHCRDLMEEAPLRFGGETRVSLETLTRRHAIDTDAFGTVDFWVLNDRVLHVIDYKHGAGVPVEVEGNSQAMYYALGLALSLLPEVVVHSVVITIIQPRAPHIEGPVRSRTMPLVDLLVWGDRVLAPAMKAALSDGAGLRDGSWCRFCPAMYKCPKLLAKSQEVAKSDFGAAPPDQHDLTDSELADVLDREQLVRHFFDACRAELSKRIQAGLAGTDRYKLVAKRAVRHWKDVETIEHDLLDVAGFLPKELYTQKLKSPAQIEKMVRQSKYSTPEMEAAVAALTEKVSSGTTLVPADDPRDALDQPGTEFDSITEETGVT